jgi:hypothetical protein
VRVGVKTVLVVGGSGGKILRLLPANYSVSCAIIEVPHVLSSCSAAAPKKLMFCKNRRTYYNDRFLARASTLGVLEMFMSSYWLPQASHALSLIEYCVYTLTCGTSILNDKGALCAASKGEESSDAFNPPCKSGNVHAKNMAQVAHKQCGVYARSSVYVTLYLQPLTQLWLQCM